MGHEAHEGFHRLRVREVRRETADAVSIAFDVPDALRDAFAFTAGQYLTLRATLAGEEVRRSYSICSSPADGELRVAVKRLPGGAFSGYANRELRAGDEVEAMPPAGSFTRAFGPDQPRNYVAFAAGSGITPILSIARTVLALEPDSRFTLCYGNRTGGEILFLEELAALKNQAMGRFRLFHFLTIEEEEIDLFNGRLDRAKCDRILRSLVDPDEVDLFLACGPEGMMVAVEGALHARGVGPDRIMLERFGAGAAARPLDAVEQARLVAAQGRRLAVTQDGRRVVVPFDAAQGNILDSVRAAGIPAPFACKGGVCATCRAKVLTGEVAMRVNFGLTADEVAQGYVLTCQATPLTDDVALSYDA